MITRYNKLALFYNNLMDNYEISMDFAGFCSWMYFIYKQNMRNKRKTYQPSCMDNWLNGYYSRKDDPGMARELDNIISALS